MDRIDVQSAILRSYAERDTSKRAAYLRQASAFAEKHGPFVRTRVGSELGLNYIEGEREDGTVIKCALIAPFDVTRWATEEGQG